MRYAILSSFDVMCGNATYSECLASALEKRGENVERIKVPTEIQKSDSVAIQNEILKKIRKCDILNIQLEIGLYGSAPHHSAKFIRKILKVCPPKTTVTVHRTEPEPPSFLRLVKNEFKSLRLSSSTLIAFKAYSRAEYLWRSYRSIYQELRRQEKVKNIRVISHTHNDQERLKHVYNVDSILHPIMWPNELLNNKDKISECTNSRMIGVFGFVSSHKNFELVIEAVAFLIKQKKIDKSAKLLICGGHHPEAPGYGIGLEKAKSQNVYTKKLSDLLIQKKLNADWIVGASDEEMAELISSVDVVCIPYIETGQSGSGITSQSLQFAKGIAMSDTKMALQHQKMCDEKIVLFDSASIVSCAYAILQATKQKKPPRFQQSYSFERIVDIIQFSQGDQNGI